MSDQTATLSPWRPPPPGDPVPPFPSPVVLTVAPPVALPELRRAAPMHRLGLPGLRRR